MTDVPIVVLSSLIRIPDIVCETRTPEFITFINPIPEKGLALVAALVEMRHAQNKLYKFLFVGGRGKKDTVYEAYPALKERASVLFADNTDTIRVVYERTSLVLFPSIWFEAAGRVLIEANANGIPVLAIRVSGISEVLDGAGYLFDPPQDVRDDFSAPPPQEYVAQWLEVIDRLHTDDAEMADAVARANAAAARYSLRTHAETFLAAVS